MVVADSFDGPIGAYRGARVGRFDMLPPQPIASLSQTSLSFAATVGDAAATPSTHAITITNIGDGTLNWTAVPSATWMHVLPGTGTSVASASTLSVSVDVPTTGGTLTGSIAITAPGASPVTVTVVFTVTDRPAQISLGTTALTFTANRGSAAPAVQTANLTNSGGQDLVWSVGPVPSWLVVAPASGTLTTGGTAPLSFAVNHAALARGPYTATVTVSDPNASNPSASVAVALNVAAPTIAVPSTLALSANQGSTASQAVIVTNTGDGALTFTPSAAAGWLAVSPPGAITVAPGGTVTLTVTAGGAALAVGTHNGSITIGDSAATNGAQTVAVTLTVSTSGVVTLTPASLALSISKGAALPNQTITVANSGGADFSYTTSVTAGGAWLSVVSGGAGTVTPPEAAS